MSVRVRATALHNTVRSVRERFGPEAHERVLASLPAARCGVFLAGVREAGWVAMEDVVAYMEAARRLLAPDDEAFHRALGRDAGLRVRDTPTRNFIGEDPRAALTRSNFFWHSYYDAGRVEAEELGPHDLRFVLRDFRSSGPAWCERTLGFVEGCCEIWGLAGARVTEEACVHRGDASCVLRLTW